MAEILDLRPRRAEPDDDLAAEFAVIGCALYDNAVTHRLDGLTPEDFGEPTYGRIWATILTLVSKGRAADVITVHAALIADPGLESLGGLGHLANLVDKAPPSHAAGDYAGAIIDRARRRRVCDIAAWAQHALKTGLDTGETVEALEAELLAIQRARVRVRPVGAEEAVRLMLDDLAAPPEQTIGVFTGIGPLDDHLGAMQPDELILIAGRPGSGKSALGSCIALNIARTGVGVIEINSEMSVAQMMRRHISDAGHARFGAGAPTYRDIKRRLLTAGQRGMIEAAAREVRELPIALVKKTGLTLSALRSLVRRQASIWASQGITLGAITVDHVGLLSADNGGRDRYTDQTAIAIGMKALADELHVPVIAMVQLSRKVEDRDNKHPQLWDLRDSGAWEENADTAFGLYREAYYAAKDGEPKDGRSSDKWNDWDRRRQSKTVDVGIMKVREGEEKTIQLWCSIGHNAIRGADPDDRGGGFL